MSNIIRESTNDRRISSMAKAIAGWQTALSTSTAPPAGLFGRKVVIQTGDVTITNDVLDVEFDVPFDDDTEANEATIVVYNLTQNTTKQIKKNAVITITAGYTGDTGMIFSGRVVEIRTKWDGSDRKTTIYAIDRQDMEERDVEEIAYKAGTKASYILKDLVNKLKLPVAVFKVRRDHKYKDKVNITGGLMDNIRRLAGVCGVSAYIHKGKVYVRPLKDGDDISFTVNESTGLIGTPEEFDETETNEDYEDAVHGYNVKMLLQHRVATAAIINLNSREANGRFRVRSGRHICNESEFVTEMEVIQG